MFEEVGVISSVITLIVVLISCLLFFVRLEARQKEILEFLRQLGSNSSREHAQLHEEMKEWRLAQREKDHEIVSILREIRDDIIKGNAAHDEVLAKMRK